ncbi:MAG: MFS transporter [Phycisphaerae bacterium]|nr:MFS transporter [Phycisphaerae bacterium]|tara:strand:+ start:1195 stop:2565 length:1371 start_codon:yes stop_codon:yes gene_type:complete
MSSDALHSERSLLLARFDRIEKWPWNWSLLAVIGFGFFFSFFDIITIGLSLKVLQSQFEVSEATVNWAVTTSLLGYIVGSFLDSRIADRFGRRIALYISVGLFTIGSILTATAWEFWMVLMWRFISGMGIGAEIAGVTTYMGEMSPRGARGRYTSMAVACGFLGFAFVPFVGALLVPEFSWGWRLLFLIGGLGGLVICFMRRNMPDSPRWLLEMGRIDAAREVIERAEANSTVRSGAAPPPIDESSITEVTTNRKGSLATLLHPPNRNRLWFFALIWFFYYTGNYAWLELSDELLVQKGFQLGKSLWLTGIASIGFVVGSALAIVFSDRVERKWSCSFLALAWTILLLLIGWFPSEWMVMGAGFVAAISISMIIPMMYTYTAELFPTTVRATGVSITDGIGHIGGALCPQIVLGLAAIFATKEQQFPAALSVMAATGLLTAILLACGPKTRHMDLD